VEWSWSRERNVLAFWLIQCDRAIKQREWLFRRSVHSSKQSIWGLLTCSNIARHALGMFGDGVLEDILLHQRVQSEYSGTSFIIKLVVHLKVVLWRVLHTKSAAIPSCSLATSTWTTLMNWYLGWGIGRVGHRAGKRGWDLMLLVPSQIFFHLNPMKMVGPLRCRQHRSPSKSSVR